MEEHVKLGETAFLIISIENSEGDPNRADRDETIIDTFEDRLYQILQHNYNAKAGDDIEKYIRDLGLTRDAMRNNPNLAWSDDRIKGSCAQLRNVDFDIDYLSARCDTNLGDLKETV